MSMMRGRKPTDPRVWVPLLLLAAFTFGPSLLDSVTGTDNTNDAVSASSSDRTSDSDRSPSDQRDDQPVSGLATISANDLPAEAIDTLILIDSGGPFPFDKDDSTFQNREGILPDEDQDWYREYTVITPGESTRGARRIVAGAENDLYWTDDHYSSFSEIVDW